MSNPHRVFSRRLERELQQHPGRWLAISGDRILTVGDSPGEVAEAAWAAGVETPLLLRVPEPDVLHFYPVRALRPAAL